MEANKIIKKKPSGLEKEKVLLDELISQIETEKSAKPNPIETKPIEITDQVKAQNAVLDG